MDLFVTSGACEGSTTLGAFDSCLASMNAHNHNLIRLSSVIPPDASIKMLGDDGKIPAMGTWGDRLYVVMAEQVEDRAGKEAWAGVGWVLDETTNKGLFVEHEEETRELVEEKIRLTMEDLRANRPDDTFGETHMHVRGITCVDKPVASVVLAVYASEPW